MYDFADHIQQIQFVSELNKRVEEYCVKEFTDDPRNHLGASIIGSDCAAYSWGIFRWLKQEPFSGRMLRLFNRGHLEEARFVKWLRGAGLEISEFDEDGNQYRIVGVKGHFGGSLDGRAAHITPKGLLLEFKTHSDRSFKDLQKKGVIRSKPKHYRQMCSYGRAYDLNFGLYCAVNKNDDDLHFEIVPINFNEADDLFRKAESIIFSQTQPQKIAQVETYTECKYCTFAGICFKGEAPEVNCRSCKNAFPVDNGEWLCKIHNQVIPADILKVGCKSYGRII